MATVDQRTHLLAVMDFLLAHASQVKYNQLRPMGTFVPSLVLEQDCMNRFAKGETISPDCSEMVTLICRWCGLHDPSGPAYNYDGYGNTNTIYSYLSHPINPQPHVGALVTFGAPTISVQHIAMVYSPPTSGLGSTVLFSHGSSAGPIKLTLAEYEAAEPWQIPVTFLSVANL